MSSISEVGKENEFTKSKVDVNNSMSLLGKNNPMNLKIIEQFEQATGLEDPNWR